MGVRFEVEDGVALVTLDRPAKLNAITVEMRAELQQAWHRIAADDDVLVAIVTGAGERAFCVGSDLSATAGAAPGFAAEHLARSGGNQLVEGLSCDTPVIAAVNGLAVGGGMEIALACDIRLAAPTAEFGLSEVRVGSMPGAGGTQRLVRSVGESLAMQMLLTGDRIDAATALRSGLVSEVVDGPDLVTRAREIAGRIAANAPLSVRAVKRVVRLGADAPLSVGLELERLAFGAIRATDDRREGREAFAAKRPPNYTGR
jgi:E-phenylitaconyl-CoA hydratase